MTIVDWFVVVCIWMAVAAVAAVIVNTGDDDE